MKDFNLVELDKLSEKFTEQEQLKIISLVKSNLPKVYILPIYMTFYQSMKHSYMVSTTIIMLLLIFAFDFPLLSFFVPLIPILFINVFSFIESNIITFKMNRVHNILIGDNIQIKWDELMILVIDILLDRFFGNGEYDDYDYN